jgi:mannose-6-phosphate isomerase-like protein (cupin superfamily)
MDRERDGNVKKRPAARARTAVTHLGSRELERRRLGAAIRASRNGQQRTLADVAAAAGISISLLSQVERGLVDPSLDSLRDIADALNTKPSQLLQDGAERSRIVRRVERRKLVLPDDGCEYEFLSPSLDGAFEVGMWTLQPGKASSDWRRAHQGEEGNLILEGRVLIEIGDEQIELEEGDFFTFDARVPHRVTAVGPEPARALFIISPPAF